MADNDEPGIKVSVEVEVDRADLDLFDKYTEVIFDEKPDPELSDAERAQRFLDWQIGNAIDNLWDQRGEIEQAWELLHTEGGQTP